MKIIKILILLVFTIFGGSCKDKDICKKYFQQEYLNINIVHEDLFKSGNSLEAIRIVEKIIENEPENYIAINYLGSYKYLLCSESQCSLKELKEIYDLNKKSISICQYYREGYFNAIEILAELSKTKYENDAELIKLLGIYNSRYDKKSNLLTKGGEAMFRLGNINKSLEYLDEAIELNPNEAMAYIFKGKCYTALAEWGDSMEMLNKGLSLDSLSIGFHERGYVNKELGNIDEAINDYKTAILLYENRFESYVGIGAIEIERNNLETACRYFNEAKELKGANEIVELWIEKYCQI